LQGKTALVTGGSRGIGYAIADRLAAEGCSVRLVARDAARLAEAAAKLKARHGSAPQVHAVDLGSSAAVETVYPLLDGVDVLVNSAGDVPRGGVLDMSTEKLRAAFDVKLFATLALCREALCRMKERGGGVIVNIIGTSGEKPNPRAIPTTTINAALMAYTQAMGAGSVDHNVRVVGINPGIIKTDRHAYPAGGVDELAHRAQLAKLPWGRMGRPEEVADLVAFVASARASYISGSVLTIDAGHHQRA
jgi:3-oxoacyl-[acyl-carrier protein] reductase